MATIYTLTTFILVVHTIVDFSCRVDLYRCMIYFSCFYCINKLACFLTSVISWLARPQAGVHFFVYPFFASMDLFGIYQGLKHVHLQTLTKVGFLMPLTMRLCTDSKFSNIILERLKLSDFGRNKLWRPFHVRFCYKNSGFVFPLFIKRLLIL
jgi:hypothetical protein